LLLLSSLLGVEHGRGRGLLHLLLLNDGRKLLSLHDRLCADGRGCFALFDDGLKLLLHLLSDDGLHAPLDDSVDHCLRLADHALDHRLNDRLNNGLLHVLDQVLRLRDGVGLRDRRQILRLADLRRVDDGLQRSFLLLHHGQLLGLLLLFLHDGKLHRLLLLEDGRWCRSGRGGWGRSGLRLRLRLRLFGLGLRHGHGRFLGRQRKEDATNDESSAFLATEAMTMTKAVMTKAAAVTKTITATVTKTIATIATVRECLGSNRKQNNNSESEQSLHFAVTKM